MRSWMPMTFSWSKCRRSLISRNVRFAVVLFLNTLEIFLIAQACEGLHHRT